MASPNGIRPEIAPLTRPKAVGASAAAARRSIGVAVAIALALMVAPSIAQPKLRFVWNVSASVPLGLYRIEPGRSPQVGELAAVRPSQALARLMAERHYVERGALLVKPVAAVAGAHVCRQRDAVTVNGMALASALNKDRFGRDLPRWSGCRKLDASQYFLLAPAIRASFDSRYFGPVAAESVIGRATPLWVWP